MRVCLWIVLCLFTTGALTMIYEGLIGHVEPLRERGPAQVLIGCGALVLVGFAIYGVWIH